MGKVSKITIIASYALWAVGSITLACLGIVSWITGLLWLIAIPVSLYIFLVIYGIVSLFVAVDRNVLQGDCMHYDITKVLNDGKPCFGRQMGEKSCPCQYFEQKPKRKSK